MKLTFRCKHRNGLWVAQCMEYELCTQAKTLDDLLIEVRIYVERYIEGCAEDGRTPWLLRTPQDAVDEFADALVIFEVYV